MDKDFIISKECKLFVKEDKLILNNKEIEIEEKSKLEEITRNKKIELYKEFLSRHFENTVVLTGAGSSYGIGKSDIKGQTMKSLWRKIVDELTEDKIKEIADTINYSFNDITDVNLEDFLSKASMYQILYDINPDKDFYKTLNSIKKVIVENCSIIITDDAPHKEFLKRITARKLKYNRLKVFTTNYDMLFEQAAISYGFVVIDGFSFTFPRYFNGNNFDYDIVIRKNSRISARENYANKVFHLYKLHGSLDWFQEMETNRIIKVNSENNEHPVMIFPSSIKYETSYEQPFFEMMSRFQAELRQDNTLLLVVGYSFGDKHINSMIYEALNLNHSLQLVLIDPYIDNFDKLIEQSKSNSNIWLIRSDFKEMALNYPFAQVYGIGEERDDLDATI